MNLQPQRSSPYGLHPVAMRFLLFKKEIVLQEKYFTYPLSLQCICLDCSLKEIPKIMEALESDLEKTRELLKPDKKNVK